MERIYHTWDKWECYPAGMYESQCPDRLPAKEAHQRYAEFLRDTDLFARELRRVFAEWPNSCEHYLSNEKMNRIAWLGQAAICHHSRIPRGFRGGFNLLTPEEQDAANQTALDALNEWLRWRNEPEVTMEDAGLTKEVDLY